MKICYTIILLSCIVFTGSIRAQGWSKATKFPGNIRDGAIEFSIGSNVYFGCGGVSDFWEFNTISSTWTKKANIPSAASRGFAAGFSIGNKGYVGLGNNGSAILKDMWEYDPTTNKWTKKADYPAGGRDAILAFSINGKAYIGGGTDNQYIYSEFFEFDPAANTWTALDALPMGGVAFPSSFVISSLAYITGGDLGTGNGQLSSLYSFDPAMKEWKMLSDFPGDPRQTAVSFTIGSKGYVGLGQADYDTVFTDFYSYTPETDSWNRVGVDFPIAPGRAWASAASVGGKAYVGGGWDFGANFFNDWWSFDPSAPPSADVKAESLSSNLMVFPNPTASVFRLAGTNSSSFNDLRIFDILGNERMHVLKSADGTYNVSSLPAGEYFAHISGQSFSTAVKLEKK